MLQTNAGRTDAPGTLEIVVCRYKAKAGEIISPAPHPAANDAYSTPWECGDVQWLGGAVVLTWVRRSAAVLRPTLPMDAPLPDPVPQPPALMAPSVDGPAAAPETPDTLTPEEQDLAELGRLLQSTTRAAVPSVIHPPAPAPIAPPLPILQIAQPGVALPSYARERAPLATQQNVSVRGGTQLPVPVVAPGYVPPPVTSSGGLLASAEVKAYGGPLPPMAPVVPPSSPGRNSVLPTVAVDVATGAPGLAGTPPTAPPRSPLPPVTVDLSPVNRALFPRAELVPTAPPAPPAVPFARVLSAVSSGDASIILAEAEALESEGWGELAKQLRTELRPAPATV